MNEDHDTVARHFDELDEQLRTHGTGAGLAEIHGMASGLVCAGRTTSRDEDWRALLGEDAVERGTRRVLDAAFSLALRSLGADDFAFAPLLPGDEAPISRRVECIADWCSGFLQGWQLAGGESADGVAAEALGDIRRIAGIVPDDEDAETQRGHLVEIEEYLRVAAQILYDGAESPRNP